MSSLKSRVEQFNAMSLPGQPLGMHMGTSYLVNDLWRSHQGLLDALTKAFENKDAVSHGRRPPHNDMALLNEMRAAIARATHPSHGSTLEGEER